MNRSDVNSNISNRLEHRISGLNIGRSLELSH